MHRLMIRAFLILALVFAVGGTALATDHHEADAHLSVTGHWHNWTGTWTLTWQQNCGQYTYPANQIRNCYWNPQVCLQNGDAQWVWSSIIDIYYTNGTYQISTVYRSSSICHA